jgi:hypothetical protein
VRLSSVVDLVLKEVGEQTRYGLMLNPAAALDPNLNVEQLVGERDTEIDETAIDGSLRDAQGLTSGKRLFRLEKTQPLGVDLLAREPAFERIDVIPIDGDDVIERGLERREKARPWCLEFGLRQ